MRSRHRDILYLIFFVLLSALGVLMLLAAPSRAADASTDNILAGVWRGGKAVFSDIAIFDLLVPERFRRGFKPEQPVPYSHKQHVDKLGMECQYCHFGVHKSPFAVLPSVDSCMGCHLTVKQDLPGVKKLQEYWDKKQPVHWTRVNNLPEHVQFTHKRHVQAGVACYICHGQVNKMDVVEKVSSLKMGFCVSCHRETGASVDCAVCHY